MSTTKRERETRAALLDAATDVAAILGGTPEPSHELGAELAEALGRLYEANDAWQEAQCDVTAKPADDERRAKAEAWLAEGAQPTGTLAWHAKPAEQGGGRSSCRVCGASAFEVRGLHNGMCRDCNKAVGE